MAALSPSSCSFGEALPSEAVSSQAVTFTASAAGTYSAAISGADAARFTIQTAMSDVALAADATHVLYVGYLTDEVGVHAASLAITDASGATIASAPLSGTTVSSAVPWIYGGSTSLALGVVDVGASALGTVTVQSSADGDTYTYACSLATGAVFTISQSSASGAGGASLNLAVTFTPTAEETYEDTLTIAWTRASGTPSSGTLTVALSGTGDLDDDDDDDAGDEGDGDSSAQRATLYVPTHTSVVNLGAAYAEGGVTLTQTGFSATTARNVYVSAQKTVTLQAEGLAWFQSSNDDVFMMSGAKTYVVADSTLYVGGRALVGLMAGYGASAVTDVELDDDGNAERPSTASEVDTGFLVAELVWFVVKKVESVFGLVRAVWAHHTIDDPDSKALGKLLPVGAIKAAFGIKVAVLSLVAQVTRYAYSRIAGSDLHAVSLYSEAGMNLGTPAFTTLAGTISTFVAGLHSTLVGYAHLSVEGLYTVALASMGETAVVAGKDVSAITGWGTYTIASRAGPLAITGSTVKVGTILPDGFQAPTVQTTIDAMTKLGFEALAPGAGEVSFSSTLASVELTSVAGISITTANEAKLGSPAAYTIEATPAGLKITSLGAPVVELLPGVIKLGPAAVQIAMAPSLTDIGGAIKITPAAAVCMAAAVDLL